MSAALVATGEADTSPAGGKSQNGASGDTAVRRKFLDQFEVTNDTQMTGFDPERDFTAPVRGRSLTDDMSTKRKKRKVSVVGRGIPVL
ncbi:hypothetical protein HK097_007198 [Rhizophlyctis rosea]|uniref:Uncharacterized protein n=1 Tax=Rhizophlyctis rosea TaxID=64517 RepID=A0AAD5SJH2_9FUNG|nr:hypothetical protein HK097_007198 [Rhizophlyctis rosea]